MDYYSVIKKKKRTKILPFTNTWMELSQKSGRERQILYYFTHVESKNKTINEQTNKQKSTHKFREHTGGRQRGGECEDGQNR